MGNIDPKRYDLAIKLLQDRMSSDNKQQLKYIQILQKDLDEYKIIVADEIHGVVGEFEIIRSEIGEFEVVVTNKIEATSADIKLLEGDVSLFKQSVAEQFLGVDAKFENLDTETANIKELFAGYVQVDKANIDQAWVEELLVKGSFLAADVNSAIGSFSKYLTGVNIVGENITAGKIITDRLIIRDPDNNTGILYEINNGVVDQTNLSAEELKRLTLDGKIITAESITADKINVFDLFAQNITSTGDFNMGGKGALVYDSETDDLSIRVSSLTIGTTAAATKGDVKDLQDYVNDNEIKAAASLAEMKTKMEMLEGQINMKVEASDIASLAENMNIGSRNLIRNSKDLIYNKHHFGHAAHKPFKLKKPLIYIDQEKLSAPVITLIHEDITDTRSKLKAPVVSLVDKLDTPEIDIISAKLDAPVIRLESSGTGPTAVLGFGVLGSMVLGDESRLTAPEIVMTEGKSAVLGEAVLGEMVLGEE